MMYLSKVIIALAVLASVSLGALGHQPPKSDRAEGRLLDASLFSSKLYMYSTC